MADNRMVMINCEMANPFDYPITGVDVSVHVKAKVGNHFVEIAQGLPAHVSRGEPPTLYLYPPKSQLHFVVLLRMEREILGEIEKLRSSDVALSVSGDVVYSIAHRQQGHYFMGERRWDVLTRQGKPERHTIPQSEWLQILSRMHWKDYEILEIPRNPSGDSRFARAYGQLQVASGHYRNGQWDTCMMHCRKAYEAAMKDASNKEDMAKAAASVLSKHHGPKKEKLNDLLLALGEYTHLARHEGSQPVSFDKFDAAQCLFMTTAAIDFIANQ